MLALCLLAGGAKCTWQIRELTCSKIYMSAKSTWRVRVYLVTAKSTWRMCFVDSPSSDADAADLFQKCIRFGARTLPLNACAKPRWNSKTIWRVLRVRDREKFTRRVLCFDGGATCVRRTRTDINWCSQRYVYLNTNWLSKCPPIRCTSTLLCSACKC